MTWPIREQRLVYENPWIRVVEDRVVRPDGGDGVYGVVELRNTAVFVVALTDDDEVVLVTLDRHTVGASVEVPAGGADGDDPLVAAQRELLEETGLEAAHWREIGRMQALNGVCRAGEVVFLATGLRESAPAARPEHHQAEEGIRRVGTVPWGETMRMVRDGRIRDGETVAALMYAALALGRVD
ncbi:NUDIX domain-containing protein [Agromyces aurantiacus]|uniref:NUDIX domain-containing protein n=1 Tax=Agromyces aurantiacus TaxID=165814 RepID=A0ABV9QZJ7_9MICO|nr:NUDIX hydrolase [Agromyces aurantiacus]MBM7505626.1 8-oxo-dGTP pyrophosphatase MutT (NUDIX family) [Agromyces aurantiacus]